MIEIVYFFIDYLAKNLDEYSMKVTKNFTNILIFIFFYLVNKLLSKIFQDFTHLSHQSSDFHVFSSII